MRGRTRFWTTRRWKSGARRQFTPDDRASRPPTGTLGSSILPPSSASARRPGQEAGESSKESSADSENEIRGNARPHPGPLPQERGKQAQRPGIFIVSGVAPPPGDSRRKPREFLVAAERLPMVRAVYPDSEV